MKLDPQVWEPSWTTSPLLLSPIRPARLQPMRHCTSLSIFPCPHINARLVDIAGLIRSWRGGRVGGIYPYWGKVGNASLLCILEAIAFYAVGGEVGVNAATVVTKAGAICASERI
jgi:hypothetical protein